MATEIKWADGNAIVADSTLRWADGDIYDYYYVVAAGGVFADNWHPEIQQPVRERIEIIGY